MNDVTTPETGLVSYPSQKYFEAIGRALFEFQVLESDIVAFIEVEDPKFSITRFELTSNLIFNRFSEEFNQSKDHELFARAVSFLADRRNMLAHATPALDGLEFYGLMYVGRSGVEDWTLDRLNSFSEECIMARKILHKMMGNMSFTLPTEKHDFLEEMAQKTEKWKKGWEKKRAAQSEILSELSKR